MPGAMFCPRRSLPFAENRKTPNSAPGGIVGSVTLDSPVFGPDGMAERSQISTYAEPLSPTIFVPALLSEPRIGAATSEGGSPAGCALYCAKTAVAARRREQIRIINFILVCHSRTRVAQLIGKFFKDVLSANKAVANHTRTHVGRHDQLNVFVCDAETIRPAAVGSFLNHELAYFNASTASRGAPVMRPLTSPNPAPCSNAEYSLSVRSRPSVQISMLSDCMCVVPEPLRSSFNSFSAISNPPPSGSAA